MKNRHIVTVILSVLWVMVCAGTAALFVRTEGKLHSEEKAVKAAESQCKNRTSYLEDQIKTLSGMGHIFEAELNSCVQEQKNVLLIGDSYFASGIFMDIKFRMGMHTEVQTVYEIGANWKRIAALVSRASREARFIPTHIIVMGGTNDLAQSKSHDAILEGKNKVNMLLRAVWPTADIWYVNPFVLYDCTYAQLYAEENTISTYSLCTEEAKKRFYSRDNIHLNLDGEQQLAELIYQQVKWCTFDLRSAYAQYDD